MIPRPLQKLGGDSPFVPTTNLMRISHPARMKTIFLSKLRFFFSHIILHLIPQKVQFL